MLVGREAAAPGAAGASTTRPHARSDARGRPTVLAARCKFGAPAAAAASRGELCVSSLGRGRCSVPGSDWLARCPMAVWTGLLRGAGAGCSALGRLRGARRRVRGLRGTILACGGPCSRGGEPPDHRRPGPPQQQQQPSNSPSDICSILRAACMLRLCFSAHQMHASSAMQRAIKSGIARLCNPCKPLDSPRPPACCHQPAAAHLPAPPAADARPAAPPAPRPLLTRRWSLNSLWSRWSR